jgi:hypothetical protein
MSNIAIQTKQITDTFNVDSIDVSLVRLNFGVSAIFNVTLKQNGAPVRVEQVTMDKQDYLNWGSNDNYVIQFICLQLGLTLVV